MCVFKHHAGASVSRRPLIPIPHPHQPTPHTPQKKSNRLDRFIARVNSLLDLTRTILSFSRLAKARWFRCFMYMCMYVLYVYMVGLVLVLVWF